MTYTQYSFERNLQEDMVYVVGFGYLSSLEMLPVRRHQIQEEVIKFQKEFASEIYYQRCKEKDL